MRLMIIVFIASMVIGSFVLMEEIKKYDVEDFKPFDSLNTVVVFFLLMWNMPFAFGIIKVINDLSKKPCQRE